MIQFLKEINSSTFFAEEDCKIYIAKVISLEDVPMYKLLMSVQNPNIIKFYKTEVVNQKFCVIEEYIQGETLENYVLTRNKLSDEQIKDIIIQICNGLAEIHNLGIVHRDINPSNIMVCNDGTVKIIDFGISRRNKLNQRQDTTILGTQGYAAPEQYGFDQTNARSDIYALGVLINFLKTKKMPNEELAPGKLGDIVIRCTQIDSAKRYESIPDLLDSLMGRGNYKSIFSKIPGYRKGIWWHIIIATIYYLFLLLIFAGLVIASDSIRNFVSYMGCFLCIFVMPVPILTNYGNWTKKSNLTRFKNKSSKITIQIILAFISMCLSYFFIILYKTP